MPTSPNENDSSLRLARAREELRARTNAAYQGGAPEGAMVKERTNPVGGWSEGANSHGSAPRIGWSEGASKQDSASTLEEARARFLSATERAGRGGAPEGAMVKESTGNPPAASATHSTSEPDWR